MAALPKELYVQGRWGSDGRHHADVKHLSLQQRTLGKYVWGRVGACGGTSASRRGPWASVCVCGGGGG